MFEFFDRLVNMALPRVRDFRGLSTKSFDGRGNYTLGLRDQLIFPEIDYSQGQQDQRDEYLRCHHGQNRRRGQNVAPSFGLPFRN